MPCLPNEEVGLRFYVFDDIKEQPRELTRVVKCVKYFSYWDFDSMERDCRFNCVLSKIGM